MQENKIIFILQAKHRCWLLRVYETSPGTQTFNSKSLQFWGKKDLIINVSVVKQKVSSQCGLIVRPAIKPSRHTPWLSLQHIQNISLHRYVYERIFIDQNVFDSYIYFQKILFFQYKYFMMIVCLCLSSECIHMAQAGDWQAGGNGPSVMHIDSTARQTEHFPRSQQPEGNVG